MMSNQSAAVYDAASISLSLARLTIPDSPRVDVSELRPNVSAILLRVQDADRKQSARA